MEPLYYFLTIRGLPASGSCTPHRARTSIFIATITDDLHLRFLCMARLHRRSQHRLLAHGAEMFKFELAFAVNGLTSGPPGFRIIWLFDTGRNKGIIHVLGFEFVGKAIGYRKHTLYPAKVVQHGEPLILVHGIPTD